MSFDYLGYGLYAGQVCAYLEAFDRVHCCWYDEFRRDPAAVVNGVLRFLRLGPVDELDTRTRYNVSGAPKSPLHAMVARLVYRPNAVKAIAKGLIPKGMRYAIRTRLSSRLFTAQRMPDEVRRFLLAYYREDVTRLAAILGRDLESWVR
jgi:hypothetical protein